MPQIFHRSFNTISKVSIFGAVFVLAGVTWVLTIFYRSPYITTSHLAYVQPVPFSHEHHVGRLGIDCRYCHTSVETSSFAGVPPTKTCMNCHQQIWVGSEMLQPVRDSYRTGESIQWQRVHNLPQFVYFNHSIHIHKGIGCVSCHGRVDQMPLTYQDKPLLMDWCLECHRDPAKNVRPRDEVFNMAWQLPKDFKPEDLVKEYRIQDPRAQALIRAGQISEGLVKEYRIQDSKTITSCSTCHR